MPGPGFRTRRARPRPEPQCTRSVRPPPDHRHTACRRQELVGLWDTTVRLEVGAAERYRRLALRDGSPADPDHPDNRRYVLAHTTCERRCAPAARADLALDATDPADLRLLP